MGLLSAWTVAMSVTVGFTAGPLRERVYEYEASGAASDGPMLPGGVALCEALGIAPVWCGNFAILERSRDSRDRSLWIAKLVSRAGASDDRCPDPIALSDQNGRVTYACHEPVADETVTAADRQRLGEIVSRLNAEQHKTLAQYRWAQELRDTLSRGPGGRAVTGPGGTPEVLAAASAIGVSATLAGPIEPEWYWHMRVEWPSDGTPLPDGLALCAALGVAPAACTADRMLERMEGSTDRATWLEGTVRLAPGETMEACLAPTPAFTTTTSDGETATIYACRQPDLEENVSEADLQRLDEVVHRLNAQQHKTLAEFDWAQGFRRFITQGPQ